VTGKFRAWMADPRERRRAMIISAACMLLVLLVVAMQILSPQKKSGVQTQPEAAKFTVPARPKKEPVRSVLPEATRLPAKKPAVITPATPTGSATSAKAAKAVKLVKHTPAKPAAKASGKAVYYVQIGAFRQHKNALTFKKRRQNRGWTLSVRKKKNGMYSVLAGPWDTFTLAEAAKKKLAAQHIKGFTIRQPATQ